MATALAALAGCVGLLALRDAEYEARARILLSPIAPYDDDLVDTGLLTGTGDPTRDAQTAAATLESDRASAVTAGRLGLSRADVASSVSIEPVGESNVLRVTATAAEPDSARRLANEYARAALAIQDERAQRLLRSAIDQAVEQRRSVGEDDAASADLAQRINRLEAAYGRGGDPTLRLLEPATAPGSQVGLGPGLIVAVVFFGGLGFGVLLALVVDSLSPRLTDADELARISGLPILARVPGLPRRQFRGALSLERLSPAERDAFDALCVQVEERLGGGGTVLVVSASAKDGRTAAAAGLVLALAAAGHAVTAVDAHATRPRLAARLGGEVNVLAAENGETADRIAEASELADFVVVDTPPFSENSDALALTHVVDATILVARAGHTGLTALTELCALLDRAGGVVTGAVMMGQGGSPQVLQVRPSPVDVGKR